MSTATIRGKHECLEVASMMLWLCGRVHSSVPTKYTNGRVGLAGQTWPTSLAVARASQRQISIRRPWGFGARTVLRRYSRPLNTIQCNVFD